MIIKFFMPAFFIRSLVLAFGLLALSGLPVLAADGFLKADGRVLRDERGHGKAVQLRGANIGGWLEWQVWMCPIDSSKTLKDANPGHNGYDFEVRRLLVKRFGPEVSEELINAYLDAWITPRDLDNIKSLGLNAVRLPLSYATMLKDDGTWRPDAFRRLDAFVKSAWSRGIYTILDYHAFLPPGAEQNGSADGYWSNEAQKAETVRIWTCLAEHFKGNPGIAMYDLLNEPNNSYLKDHQGPSAATVCDLYDRFYRAIRAVDPDHVIAMEGVWDWHSLREPAKAGYQNVVYSFHWYNWNGKTTEDRRKAVDNDIQSIAKMQAAWNIPVYIGEFNLFGDKEAWKYALDQYNAQGLNWTIWTYKNKASGSNSWGLCNTIHGKIPPIPNLATDSADEIRQKWKAWSTTPETFAINPFLKSILMPPPNPGSAGL